VETAKTITDPLVITALAGAFATIIASIVTAIVTILGAIKRTNVKLDDAKNKVEENDKKTDALHQKAEKIEQLANGNLDKLRNDLNEAHQEIRKLEKALRLRDDKLFKQYGIDRRKKSTTARR
jgi:5-bromo-4-chloroindolyl phosphate hydrolysis protein